MELKKMSIVAQFRMNLVEILVSTILTSVLTYVLAVFVFLFAEGTGSIYPENYYEQQIPEIEEYLQRQQKSGMSAVQQEELNKLVQGDRNLASIGLSASACISISAGDSLVVISWLNFCFSSFRLRSILAMRACSILLLKGFPMYSSAPHCSPSNFLSFEVRAVSSTTGVWQRSKSVFILEHISIPSISGIMTSLSIRSGRSSIAFCSPSLPFIAITIR